LRFPACFRPSKNLFRVAVSHAVKSPPILPRQFHDDKILQDRPGSAVRLIEPDGVT
jgi:hypothetical protein